MRTGWATVALVLGAVLGLNRPAMALLIHADLLVAGVIAPIQS